jgi:subtilase family serine protease
MPTAFLRIVSRLSLPLVICAFLSTVTFAATADRISGALNSGQPVTLRGNVHHKALPQYDQGPVDPALKLGTITLLTSPTPAQLKALQLLVAQQQDHKSSQYHKWITPEQYADRFGLSPADIAKITAWLKSQGFSIGNVARGRNWITFSGSAGQVQSAFGTELHHFNVNGELHVANATAPQIPFALSGIVSGIRGLDDFHLKPRNIRQNAAARHFYDDSQLGDLAAPGDLATIYDIGALYTAGIDGTGQKLAVIGQTDVFLADISDFRSAFGLSAISGCTTGTTGLITACSASNFSYVLVPNAPDPGTPSLGDLTEADLDIEWSGAIARGAQIVYVNAPAVFDSNGNIVSGGVWDAWYYAVDNVSAPVISLSYGLCEFDDNITASTDETELTKANAEGITFLNSTGDSGAAECDNPTNSTSGNLAVGGLAVSYPASSPEVTGVGGTAVSYPTGFSSTYWGATNGTDGGTAQNPPLPENAWNDDEELIPLISGSTALSNQQTYDISSTGGGPSNCFSQNSTFTTCVGGFPQPSWQSSLSISGQAAVRFSPDVSLLGSPNFPGYIFCTAQEAWVQNSTSTASTCASGLTTAIETYTSIVGGTSASTPVFAGIVVLLNQYLGASGLGNINPTLYTLAKTPANGVFHPVTTGDNNVYCEGATPSTQPVALQCPGAAGSTGIFGYSATNADATTGYNLVTGLGSVDANNLALAWAATRTATSVSLVPSATSINLSASVTLTATITPSTTTGNITFSNGSTVLGSSAISAGVATLTTSALPVGANSITASYAGNATLQSATSTAVTVTVAQPFTLAATASSFQVTQGQAASATVTVTQIGGFTGTLTFSCSDPASESVCTPPAATNTTSVSFNITTTAPTSKSAKSSGGKRVFYALLLPGLLGILFTAGSRKRAARGVRFLGLIMVLGFSTLWLGSCGGSNSTTTTSNPGTPPGSYKITVTATTGGTNAATGSTTFTLVVVQ